MTCPRCQQNRYPNWTLYAALILATLCVALTIRTDKEYRAVHQIRQAGDSLLASWYAKKCIPK